MNKANNDIPFINTDMIVEDAQEETGISKKDAISRIKKIIMGVTAATVLVAGTIAGGILNSDPSNNAQTVNVKPANQIETIAKDAHHQLYKKHIEQTNTLAKSFENTGFTLQTGRLEIINIKHNEDGTLKDGTYSAVYKTPDINKGQSIESLIKMTEAHLQAKHNASSQHKVASIIGFHSDGYSPQAVHKQAERIANAIYNDGDRAHNDGILIKVTCKHGELDLATIEAAAQHKFEGDIALSAGSGNRAGIYGHHEFNPANDLSFEKGQTLAGANDWLKKIHATLNDPDLAMNN